MADTSKVVIKKPVKVFPCNGCRTRKVIVANACGMSYCQECVDLNRVPSNRDFHNYKFQHSMRNPNVSYTTDKRRGDRLVKEIAK